MREAFIKGGPLMWPLLLCSIVSIAISIERGIFWVRLARKRNDGLIYSILEAAGQGLLERALAAAKASSDYVAAVLASGLAHHQFGLKESIEDAAEQEMARMKRGLNVLDTIITLAPLLGILGTVLGIIQSFDLLGASGVVDPKGVTAGVAEALITTAAGLTIAIATLIPFNYFVSKVQVAARNLENVTTRLEIAYRRGLGRQNEAQKRV